MIKIINKKGVSLIWVILLSALLIVISTIMVAITSAESKMTLRIDSSFQAYSAAQSGITWAKDYIGYFSKPLPAALRTEYVFPDNNDPTKEFMITDPNISTKVIGTYQVVFSNVVFDDGVDGSNLVKTADISSTGRFNNAYRKIIYHYDSTFSNKAIGACALGSNGSTVTLNTPAPNTTEFDYYLWNPDSYVGTIEFGFMNRQTLGSFGTNKGLVLRYDTTNTNAYLVFYHAAVSPKPDVLVSQPISLSAANITQEKALRVHVKYVKGYGAELSIRDTYTNECFGTVSLPITTFGNSEFDFNGSYLYSNKSISTDAADTSGKAIRLGGATGVKIAYATSTGFSLTNGACPGGNYVSNFTVRLEGAGVGSVVVTDSTGLATTVTKSSSASVVRTFTYPSQYELLQSIVATPSSGNSFFRWNDYYSKGMTNNQNLTFGLNITGDMTYRAVFGILGSTPTTTLFSSAASETLIGGESGCNDKSVNYSKFMESAAPNNDSPYVVATYGEREGTGTGGGCLLSPTTWSNKDNILGTSGYASLNLVSGWNDRGFIVVDLNKNNGASSTNHTNISFNYYAASTNGNTPQLYLSTSMDGTNWSTKKYWTSGTSPSSKATSATNFSVSFAPEPFRYVQLYYIAGGGTPPTNIYLNNLVIN